ncbi:MAG: OsmC family peroxiredoxin [Flavobacteriaceae bacterium TMED179]|nr:MAG: OsmC family peroxiredoxin [Flavobacteriaceae bacterium TMED179]|tara:strand:- start:3896 stop:4315 length:420 start_codon:yes stop_codon:yes gene_type:complete
MKRKVNAIWNGGGADGNGFLTAQSGAFSKMPYSYKTRFENDNGELGTNPEELIVSALAGCFNMKLAFVLNEADFKPKSLNTNALLTFNDGSVKSIELLVKGKVPKLNEEKFIELAEYAKNNCPISGVLNCEILLNASLL